MICFSTKKTATAATIAASAPSSQKPFFCDDQIAIMAAAAINKRKIGGQGVSVNHVMANSKAGERFQRLMERNPVTSQSYLRGEPIARIAIVGLSWPRPPWKRAAL